MKSLLIVLAVAAWLFGAGYDLKPVGAAENIYCYIGDYAPPNAENGGFVSNVCLVKSGGKVWLLDAGPTYAFGKAMQQESQRLFGQGVDGVIVSNYHDDRLLGASYFEEIKVPVYVSDKVPDAIAQHKERFERIKNVIDAKLYEGTFIPSHFKLIGDEGMMLDKNIAVVKPSKAAQSPADLLIFVKDRGLVFTGNILFDGRMINFAEDSDMEGWLKAIGAVKKAKPPVIIQGHGSRMDPKAYETTENYLNDLKSQVSRIYEEGVDLSDSVKKTDFSKWSYLNYYEELQGRNVWNYYEDLEWEN